jgi:hypothetical protein
MDGFGRLDLLVYIAKRGLDLSRNHYLELIWPRVWSRCKTVFVGLVACGIVVPRHRVLHNAPSFDTTARFIERAGH